MIWDKFKFAQTAVSQVAQQGRISNSLHLLAGCGGNNLMIIPIDNFERLILN